MEFFPPFIAVHPNGGIVPPLLTFHLNGGMGPPWGGSHSTIFIYSELLATSQLVPSGTPRDLYFLRYGETQLSKTRHGND